MLKLFLIQSFVFWKVKSLEWYLYANENFPNFKKTMYHVHTKLFNMYLF